MKVKGDLFFSFLEKRSRPGKVHWERFIDAQLTTNGRVGLEAGPPYCQTELQRAAFYNQVSCYPQVGCLGGICLCPHGLLLMACSPLPLLLPCPTICLVSSFWSFKMTLQWHPLWKPSLPPSLTSLLPRLPSLLWVSVAPLCASHSTHKTELWLRTWSSVSLSSLPPFW